MKNTVLAPNIKNIYSQTSLSTANGKELNTEKVTQVYKWTIETALGTFTGTGLSINDLNNEITMLTNNARILKKNITPMTLVNETTDDRVYTWNVITHSGQVSGVAVSLEEAKKVINSFGYKEVVKSRIVESRATSI